MSEIIGEEDSSERKPRRQRVTSRLAKADSTAAIASLQSQLRISEELLQVKDSEFKAIQENLQDEIHKLEVRVRELTSLSSSREQEIDLLKSNMDALLETVVQTRNEKERLSSDALQLAAELREAKLVLAKTEAEEWRSIGRRKAWKRWIGPITGLFKRPDVGA